MVDRLGPWPPCWLLLCLLFGGSAQIYAASSVVRDGLRQPRRDSCP